MPVPMRDIVPDQPPGSAAYERIGGKVFLAENSSDADSASGGISGELDPARRVFAGNGSGAGPSNYAVV